MFKFSIIVPLYNKAPYVRKALESIVSQTFNDWELIIVDDGSTDESIRIAQEYLSTLYTLHHTPYTIKNIRIISQPNAGVAAARNNGVAASSGQFLCFLDADDWWEPTFLEEVDKLIAEFPDAGIYATNYVYYKPGKTHVALKLETGYINYPEAYLQTIAMPIWTGATCMPRKVFNEMGGFPEGIMIGEDFLLWAKTALHYKAAFCEKPLAYYNNEVPASQRSTRNLHAPKYHMLFNLEPLENEIAKLSDQYLINAWRSLLDSLRVIGLMDYWLSDEYYMDAEEELEKVDWDRQSKSVVHLYKTPRFLIRIKRKIKQIGSRCKQKLFHIVHK